MRPPFHRPLALVLALVTLSCDGGPTAPPPDSAECATKQATFTVVAPPVTFDEVGTLTEVSCKLGRGSWADRWELIVPATVDIEVSMVSDDVDAYLILRNDEEERIGSDDDSGIGGFNSGNALLAGRLAAGTYYIMATTYESGQVGNYSLSITVDPIFIP
jgi:hypothetical protein